MGTATTVEEARQLERAGVDAVIAQGSEAGAHRGTFAVPAEEALVGTVALVPQVVDAVRVPVIASGGIMDGRGLVAALALGASAVQMGTAFLACKEAGTNAAYREALLRGGKDATTLTRAFSGRMARGLSNEFIEKWNAAGLNTFLIHGRTRLRSRCVGQPRARRQAGLLSLWAGQGRGNDARNDSGAVDEGIAGRDEASVGEAERADGISACPIDFLAKGPGRRRGPFHW